MIRGFRDFDYRWRGYPRTILVILSEILLIYLFSNIPFILAALDLQTEKAVTFIARFKMVIIEELARGQLLTYVCTLIAPVIFWTFVEFNKALQTKALSILCLLLIILSVYVHGKEEGFSYIKSYHLYMSAVAIWILSVLASHFPPDPESYADVVDNQTQEFVRATRK